MAYYDHDRRPKGIFMFLDISSEGEFDYYSVACGTDKKGLVSSDYESEELSSTTDVERSPKVSSCAQVDHRQSVNVFKAQRQSAEKCYVCAQPQFTMNLPKVQIKTEKSKVDLNKVDIGTLIITNTSSEDSVPISNNLLEKLHKRIDHLERKVLRQEMVFRSIDPNIQLSSSDEECKEYKMRAVSGSGCSYIQQYSHIPETSAFQRYAQQSSPVSQGKATNLEKEHNSEQYGRDFTAYDGITARGRRQCASVPCKREEFPKMAAERVHKIRHKLNPVRDYRLMDTVHYLAQGEFAPRDDGIKLTPSREGVLSDIIWEDVCRTHWPNTRLSRRNPPPERGGTRGELQRLIDSLLRERVAHVERRRRRHYRIVKLNHRNENCRSVGKTGDIIVASHKKKDCNGEREVPICDHNAASAMMTTRRWEDDNRHKSHRSHDRLMFTDMRQRRRYRAEECSPGPSYVIPRGPGNREPTCCYHTTSPIDRNRKSVTKIDQVHRKPGPEMKTSGSSCTTKPPRHPRLVVKKDSSLRRQKDEPNLEQYILLPTLVIRTPSNVKRQKKFNELYHRILNVQINNG